MEETMQKQLVQLLHYLNKRYNSPTRTVQFVMQLSTQLSSLGSNNNMAKNQLGKRTSLNYSRQHGSHLHDNHRTQLLCGYSNLLL